MTAPTIRQKASNSAWLGSWGIYNGGSNIIRGGLDALVDQNNSGLMDRMKNLRSSLEKVGVTSLHLKALEEEVKDLAAQRAAIKSEYDTKVKQPEPAKLAQADQTILDALIAEHSNSQSVEDYIEKKATAAGREAEDAIKGTDKQKEKEKEEASKKAKADYTKKATELWKNHQEAEEKKTFEAKLKDDLEKAIAEAGTDAEKETDYKGDDAAKAAFKKQFVEKAIEKHKKDVTEKAGTDAEAKTTRLKIKDGSNVEKDEEEKDWNARKAKAKEAATKKHTDAFSKITANLKVTEEVEKSRKAYNARLALLASIIGVDLLEGFDSNYEDERVSAVTDKDEIAKLKPGLKGLYDVLNPANEPSEQAAKGALKSARGDDNDKGIIAYAKGMLQKGEADKLLDNDVWYNRLGGTASTLAATHLLGLTGIMVYQGFAAPVALGQTAAISVLILAPSGVVSWGLHKCADHLDEKHKDKLTRGPIETYNVSGVVGFGAVWALYGATILIPAISSVSTYQTAIGAAGGLVAGCFASRYQVAIAHRCEALEKAAKNDKKESVDKSYEFTKSDYLTVGNGAVFGGVMGAATTTILPNCTAMALQTLNVTLDPSLQLIVIGTAAVSASALLGQIVGLVRGAAVGKEMIAA